MWVEKKSQYFDLLSVQANLILIMQIPRIQSWCWPWRQCWSSRECSHMRAELSEGEQVDQASFMCPSSGGEEADEQRLPERFGWVLECVVYFWFFRQSLERPCISQKNKQKQGGCHFSPATRRQRKNACRWAWDVTLRFSGSWSSCR